MWHTRGPIVLIPIYQIRRKNGTLYFTMSNTYRNHKNRVILLWNKYKFKSWVMVNNSKNVKISNITLKRLGRSKNISMSFTNYIFSELKTTYRYLIILKYIFVAILNFLSFIMIQQFFRFNFKCVNQDSHRNNKCVRDFQDVTPLHTIK